MKWTSCDITMKVSTMLYKIDIIYLFMQINLVVLFILQSVSCDRLENDLRLLSKILPGIYNNRHQYYNDIKNNVPSERRHLSVQTIFRPVHIEFIPDAYNVYVEQYLNNENAPFKQWFYSFKTDNTGVAIKMKIFNLLKSSVRQKIFKNIKNIDKLSADDISSNSGCDMFWRRLKGKTFVGATGRRCLANFKGEQVRVAISGTLTPSSLHWNEGWYSTADGRGVIVTGGPYIMKKIKTLPGIVYGEEVSPKPKQYNIESVQSDNPVKNKSPKYSPESPPKYSPESPPKYLPESPPKGHYRSFFPKRRSSILNNNLPRKKKHHGPGRRYKTLIGFEEIMAALTSGRKVYYVANITKCLVGGHANVQRSSFGDYVDIFEIHLHRNNQRRDYIKFSHKKKIREGSGFVELLRNMKLFRDGTALVDIYTIDPHHDQVVRQSMAVCKLHKRIGHIKFVTSSMEKLRTVKNFGSLRSSLKKGKPVRMIADLSKCSGGNGVNPIIGGEFRDYDFLRAGETVEFSFERYATNSNSENIIMSRHVTGQFSRDNSAIFTLTDEDNTQNRYDNYVGKETRYRCQIGKNGSARGLKIYHTGNK